ncbi:N-acyl homoserine lactonase family protein [Microbacterium sp. B2969]|uniref:N-acyl homoserine lactonase family protein n=1 Tax=Microbacterium alkaliflavum TaxID=3248839 RepID=A0ABW7QAW1_9MICO
MSVGVSILQTGTVRIRPSQRMQSASKPVVLRRMKMLFGDREWTEPLPINAYLIEHPDGPILVDTGESPHATERGWMPRWHPFFRRCVDVHVAPDEGIGTLLARRGIRPADLRAVVLTHLHHDHADGLGDVVGPPVLLSREHWQAFRRPFRATLEGALPKHWPAGFEPSILTKTGPPLGPWQTTFPITADGRVVAVPTPGHVPGHLCVVVFAEAATYLIGGDVTYAQDLLDRELTDGVNTRPRLATLQLRTIKTFAAQQPIVLLPAHDPAGAARLAAGEVYRPSALKPEPKGRRSHPSAG